MIPLIKEGVVMGACSDDHIAAISPVTTIRPSLGDELLSPEGTTTVTAASCSYKYPGLINEVHTLCSNGYDFHPFIVVQKRSEFNHAVLEGEQGIISAAAYIFAGMDFGTALTYKDAACRNTLPFIPLDTQALSCGIPSVP
jgi:hypothetical protein